MKTIAKLLQDFIEDFDLEDTGKAVCFTADVEFRTDKKTLTINSEVHLVAFKETGASVLYLLDPVVAERNIPNPIPYDAATFSYTKNEFLTVKDFSPEYGFYTLIIYPVASKCEQETTKEIEQKIMN